MADLEFADETLERFLERLASDAPAPAAGATLAVTTAMAASLVVMAARCSQRRFAGAEALIAEAGQLRADAVRLAAEDSEAYGQVLAAHRLPDDFPTRPDRIRTALEQAVRTPLAIARTAATLASLGAVVACEGNPNLRGEAAVAVLLAEAAANGAARLVEINVTLGDLDRHWTTEADSLLGIAADAVNLLTPHKKGLPDQGANVGAELPEAENQAVAERVGPVSQAAMRKSQFSGKQ